MADNDNSTPDGTGDLSLTLIEEEADSSIRRQLHDGRMFYSIIDVIALLTDSPRPRKYWNALKTEMQQKEGWIQLSQNMGQLKMEAKDGKMRETDVADLTAILRIVESVPSPKAEPVKQWLAKVGAQRLEAVAQPLAPAHAGSEIATLAKPDPDAPALAWAEYHEALAALYRRQAAYEMQARIVEARLDEVDEQIGELHDRMESVEEVSRLVPEILERLGPQTLTPAHQRWVQGAVKRLHDLTGVAYATLYTELGEAFQVAKYSDIAEYEWQQVEAWLNLRIGRSR